MAWLKPRPFNALLFIAANLRDATPGRTSRTQGADSALAPDFRHNHVWVVTPRLHFQGVYFFMLSPTCVSKITSAISIFSVVACLGFLMIAEPGRGQPADAQARAMGTRPAEPPPVIQQLNSAIEQLAARMSPAVVQVLVTSYGAVDENSRGQTAVITREHLIGSGVIVDSDGYIMTNAHVVEGAQRIHVALAMPSVNDPDQIAPLGRQRVVDARLIGLHKETDLALLKIEETGLPTLSLGDHRTVHQGQLVFAMGSPEGIRAVPWSTFKPMLPSTPAIAAARWSIAKAT